jgi:hypothetical protein
LNTCSQPGSHACSDIDDVNKPSCAIRGERELVRRPASGAGDEATCWHFDHEGRCSILYSSMLRRVRRRVHMTMVSAPSVNLSMVKSGSQRLVDQAYAPEPGNICLCRCFAVGHAVSLRAGSNGSKQRRSCVRQQRRWVLVYASDVERARYRDVCCRPAVCSCQLHVAYSRAGSERDTLRAVQTYSG